MDNQEYKICPKCGTACEPDHAFCAKCGSSFGVNEYNRGYGRPTEYADTLDGIPTAEVVDYIDKNPYSYLPKFFKYSFGSKAGWHWPVFILGFFSLSFTWFFYRKMYKAGIIVFAITLSIILSILGFSIMGINAIGEPLTDYVTEMTELGQKYHYVFDEELDEEHLLTEMPQEMVTATENFLRTVANNKTFNVAVKLAQLMSYIQLAFVVILPIFTNYWYYKKAISDIKKLNEGGYPNGYSVQSKGSVSLVSGIVSGIGGYFAIIIIAIPIMLSATMDIAVNIIEKIQPYL